MIDGRAHPEATENIGGYRADIDGLRATAIIAVVLYHLNRTTLPGGYLGVDIFFVISGYLITGILWREVVTGKFSIWRFYERRLRRIAPALIALLLVVTAIAAVIMLPIDLAGYARSLLSVLGFVSNIYFWRDSDYFSRSAIEKPLLHTWSLGIEEQFYILFPMLLILCASIKRTWTAGIILAIIVFSFAANIMSSKIGGGLPAFYLLPTRGWELGAGALLVFSRGRLSPVFAECAAAVGALLTIAALFLTRSSELLLMPPALPAVVGVALLIWTGSQKSTFVARVLGLRIATSIGLLSYSLYLWHWPVIVFTQYWLVRAPTTLELVAETVVMFVLAFLSWRFVERPFRGRSMPVRRVVQWSAVGVFVLGGAAAALIFSSGLPGRLSPAAARINAAAGTNYQCPFGSTIAFGASRACKFALPSGDPERADAVLLGNSHAQMYAPLVSDILIAHGKQGLLVAANGCLPMTETNISADCAAIAEANIAAVERLEHARVVILGLTWGTNETGTLVDRTGRISAVQGPAGVAAGLVSTVARLRRANKTVIVIGPLATPDWDVASILSRSLAFGRPISMPLFTSEAQFDDDYAVVFQSLKGVALIRPDQIQCQAGRCDYLLDGRSLFADDNHLAKAELYRMHAIFEPVIASAIAGK
jgi:peptidoglycan/LPS O-acetylase OafA/YrhL